MTFTQAANIMDTINLTCNVSGFPIASLQIDWVPSPTLNDRIEIINVTNGNQTISTLILKSFLPSDAGLYKCTVSLEGLAEEAIYNLTIGMCIYHLNMYVRTYVCIYILYTYVGMCVVYTCICMYMYTVWWLNHMPL